MLSMINPALGGEEKEKLSETELMMTYAGF